MVLTTITTTLPNDSNKHLDDNASLTTNMTNWSAEKAGRSLEWLRKLPTSPFRRSCNANDPAWKREKEEAILNCLSGKSDGGKNQAEGGEDATVDLWQLRELALSPGGLLRADIRKRAWPKLLGCDRLILEQLSSQTQGGAEDVEPSRSDLINLQHEVSRTIWNMQDHWTQTRQDQERVDAELQAALKNRKRVSFASDDAQRSFLQANPSQSPPATIATSPISEQDNEEDDDSESLLSQDDDVTFFPSSKATEDEEGTLWTMQSSFTLSTRVVRWRQSTIQEQRILYSVISSVLKTPATPSAWYEDDRYHYYTGMQDLTALLLLVLESPSLTKLFLSQLAGVHLRDAMRTDRSLIEKGIHLSFMPLLEYVDGSVYRHLEAAGLMLPNFSRQWVSCWFAQDVPHVAIASRLLDVFCVSHPLMPVYMSVALLAVHRYSLLNCDPKNMSLCYETVRALPLRLIDPQDPDSLEAVEDVIALALAYMKRLPPARLVARVKHQTACMSTLNAIPTLSLLQPPAVSWMQEDTAWTDFALLRKTRLLRSPGTAAVKAELTTPVLISGSQYPLAMASAGRAEAKGWRAPVLRLLFVACLAMVGLLLAMPEALSPSLYTSVVKDQHVATNQGMLLLPTYETTSFSEQTSFIVPRSTEGESMGGSMTASFNLWRALQDQWNRFRRLFHWPFGRKH